jgi:hypothetical protein
MKDLPVSMQTNVSRLASLRNERGVIPSRVLWSTMQHALLRPFVRVKARNVNGLRDSLGGAFPKEFTVH